MSAKAVKRSPRGSRLTTLPEVRRELVKVYHQSRNGELETQEATRFTYMLLAIARLIDGSNLSQRLDALEQGQQSPAIETEGQEVDIVHED